jgi:hypothetical protein
VDYLALLYLSYLERASPLSEVMLEALEQVVVVAVVVQVYLHRACLDPLRCNLVAYHS